MESNARLIISLRLEIVVGIVHSRILDYLSNAIIPESEFLFLSFITPYLKAASSVFLENARLIHVYG